jgi:hypothetical protein
LFSHRSEAQRTARVRVASSLAAAALDGLFKHPAGYSGTIAIREIPAPYLATTEFFRSLLCRAEWSIMTFLEELHIVYRSILSELLSSLIEFWRLG